MNRGSIDNVRAGRKAVWGGDVGRSVLFLAVTALAVASAACGDLTRQGTGSSYLVVNELRGASGAEPDKFSSTLHSDVVTVVDDAPTIFNDVAEVSLSMEMKDVASQPTSNNAITVNRYHVRYVRADGRNTPGVDVPYPFDGAFTGTVRPGSDLTATFRDRPPHREDRGATGGPGTQPGDHLDHRRDHVLRAGPDRPGRVGDGEHARGLWQLRGSGLSHTDDSTWPRTTRRAAGDTDHTDYTVTGLGHDRSGPITGHLATHGGRRH